jgi:hypothetical protein
MSDTHLHVTGDDRADACRPGGSHPPLIGMVLDRQRP